MVSSMRVALRDKERNIHRLRDRDEFVVFKGERRLLLSGVQLREAEKQSEMSLEK